jgi:hypothetical protein
MQFNGENGRWRSTTWLQRFLPGKAKSPMIFRALNR